ncbi:MAG: hypothetical protein MJZ38_02440 [archaeon]|nr:hypothetical protein [archaeon]
MTSGQYGKLEIAEFEDGLFARLMLVMGPYAAQDADILRKASSVTEGHPVDSASVGGDGVESLLLRGGDVIGIVSRGGSPFAFCIDLPLDPSGDAPADSVRGSSFHTVWLPREFFEDFRRLTSEHGILLLTEDVDPRRGGEPYHLMDRFRLKGSLDEIEVFYLDKGRRRVGDVRCHLYIG